MPGERYYFSQMDNLGCNSDESQGGQKCTAWSECSVQNSLTLCDAGFQNRTCKVEVTENPESCADNNSLKFHQQPCHKIVVQDWTPWSECVANQRTRSRFKDTCQPEAGKDVQNVECDSNTENENKIIKSSGSGGSVRYSVDCNWSEWTACTDNNNQVRMRLCRSVNQMLAYGRSSLSGGIIEERVCQNSEKVAKSMKFKKSSVDENDLMSQEVALAILKMSDQYGPDLVTESAKLAAAKILETNQEMNTEVLMQRSSKPLSQSLPEEKEFTKNLNKDQSISSYEMQALDQSYMRSIDNWG